MQIIPVCVSWDGLSHRLCPLSQHFAPAPCWWSSGFQFKQKRGGGGASSLPNPCSRQASVLSPSVTIQRFWGSPQSGHEENSPPLHCPSQLAFASEPGLISCRVNSCRKAFMKVPPFLLKPSRRVCLIFHWPPCSAYFYLTESKLICHWVESKREKPPNLPLVKGAEIHQRRACYRNKWN